MASRFITLLFFVVAFLPFSFARALDANALAVRAPPVFTFKFTGVVNAPSNQAEIPASQTCNSRAGANTYAKTAVIDAVKQGARYKQSGQVATKGKYPHVFANTPGVDTVTFETGCNANADVFEFPILNTGALLSGGPSVKTNVGTDRVLFQMSFDSANNEVDTVYCGTITHSSQNTVKDPKTGKPLQPFSNCS
ncbi:hypothetical protein MPH_11109 [Macrophomina phaseolina MS6]|uniref:ribonuclease T1 n=2 Tax=Macrophomina phaseolina TaxID=35725 RepID=K2QNX2_MACPH|nr:hypothetical protein MPH_11109 [Macrophomina phaseolina MS6]KAH7057283.1 hypothetical protein B0J12DRAFT_775013 [Macrophomina phaseolina]